ncbi:MAG: RnfABCDGE type electron transport complex subunit B [Clostridia bacterium]|nr:RnfABCDGE type electron transport complex subunit B [Clostridia bacterium]
MNIIIPAAAVGVLGLLFGLLLGYAAKKFEVKADERVDQVRELLPGANCGGCGNPSCDAYAARLVEGVSGINECAVVSNENRAKIAAILGLETTAMERTVATVLCQGCGKNSPARYEYKGVQSCRSALLVVDGPKGCPQGCIGLGDCAAVCAFDAIKIIDGLPVIDENKCHACGTCVAACPRQVIRCLPYKRVARPLCRTQLPAKDARATCKTACIHCGMCARNCPQKAIKLENGQVIVDEALCTGCGVCVEKCPTKAIKLARD